MTRLNLLGVNSDAQTFAEAIQTLLTWAQSSAKYYVCTCPVYTLMMGREKPLVRAALNQADMVTADGMPIVWLQRQMGEKQAERVYGPDVMLALCEQGQAHGLRHYFWGGLPEVVDQLVIRLQAQFPDMIVAGAYSPPMAELGTQPDADAVQRLNMARPDVIWVGLGSPKQDLWMALHRPELNAPLLIGVGAAFDMIAGFKRQAPKWMQRSGTEWLFRLLQEPRRLAKRYLVYNPLFIGLALQQIFARQKQPKV